MQDMTQKMKQLIDHSQKIAIIGHRNPDGDCIGSMLWLWEILEKQWKSVFYFIPTTPSKIYAFLPDLHKIKETFDYGDYDLIILIDLSSYDRFAPFGDNQSYFDQKPLLVIDHHLGKTPAHAIVYKDHKAISTAGLIFEFAQKRRLPYLDKKVATYLYLGLMSDSGNFLFGTDHIRIFDNALGLLKLWADRRLINYNIIRKKSLNQIQFLGLLIQRIQIQWKVLYSYYTEQDLIKYSIDEEEAAYGLVVIQNIQGPWLTVILKKFKQHIKCSLRSKEINGHSIDCNEIATYFGGWWHHEAAGCSIKRQGRFQQQMKDIITQINAMI